MTRHLLALPFLLLARITLTIASRALDVIATACAPPVRLRTAPVFDRAGAVVGVAVPIPCASPPPRLVRNMSTESSREYWRKTEAIAAAVRSRPPWERGGHMARVAPDSSAPLRTSAPGSSAGPVTSRTGFALAPDVDEPSLADLAETNLPITPRSTTPNSVGLTSCSNCNAPRSPRSSCPSCGLVSALTPAH